MIQGEINEKEVAYRQKDGLNYSSIKTFDDKGVGMFYKEFILGLREQKSSSSTLIGNLVDDIILSHMGDLTSFYQHFDEKYVKFEGVKSTGQVFILADYLFDSMIETAVNGKVTANFDICFKEAFDKLQAEGKYKGKTWEKGLEDFNANGKEYYEKKIAAIGKEVVDIVTLTKAEQVANTLLSDETTGPILRGENNSILPKLVLEFEYLGVKCKSEVDLLEIDHKNGFIQPNDLKCTFDNEVFDRNYLNFSYYLQQALYDVGIKDWAEKEGLGDYYVKPFRFIVGDTSVNNRRPLIYQISEDDRKAGYEGFSIRGYKYRGIDALIKEIKWHIDNDVWNCSKLAYENNGHLILDINYDKP